MLKSAALGHKRTMGCDKRTYDRARLRGSYIGPFVTVTSSDLSYVRAV